MQTLRHNYGDRRIDRVKHSCSHTCFIKIDSYVNHVLRETSMTAPNEVININVKTNHNEKINKVSITRNLQCLSI